MNLVVMRLKSNGHPHSLKPIVGVATNVEHKRFFVTILSADDQNRNDEVGKAVCSLLI